MAIKNEQLRLLLLLRESKPTGIHFHDLRNMQSVSVREPGPISSVIFAKTAVVAATRRPHIFEPRELMNGALSLDGTVSRAPNVFNEDGPVRARATATAWSTFPWYAGQCAHSMALT